MAKKIISVFMILGLVSWHFSALKLLADDAVPAENVTTVSTGDAGSSADIQNLNNTNLTDSPENSNTDSVPNSGSLILSTDASSTDSSVPINNTNNSTSTIDNNADVGAQTGENQILASSTDLVATTTDDAATSTKKTATTTNAQILTGDAYAGANVINVANVNVVDSKGFMFLLNNFLNKIGNIDLRNIGFETAIPGCDETCIATTSALTTNIDNNNDSNIENNLDVGAGTGSNAIANTAGNSTIDTGNANAGANVVNVANTNLVDSNYMLVTINNFGNMNGDFIFPGLGYFQSFFSPVTSPLLPGSSITNNNNATTTNNIGALADTGENSANASSTSISTGDANSAVNVANNVNQNQIGGSSVMIVFRVFGKWNGNVFNAPPGISWKETANGVELVSDDGGSVDQALNGEEQSGGLLGNITNNNNSTITNNINVYALTGDNRIDGGESATINTGDANAAANVVNIANTNIIGRNWILAFVNIFGDWSGNISFGQPNLWVGERADMPAKVGPGSKITFHYTIKNNGDSPVSGVKLANNFDNPYVSFDDGNSSWDVGRISAGGTLELEKEATVSSSLPFGTTPIMSTVSVSGTETDADPSDNSDALTIVGERSGGGGGGGGSGQFIKSPPAKLQVTDSNEASGTISASSTVNYKAIITNNGGTAYKAVMIDQLKDQQGNLINEQSWQLDDIAPNEEITLTWTNVFNASTTPGTYTNYTKVTAMSVNPNPSVGTTTESNISQSYVVIGSGSGSSGRKTSSANLQYQSEVLPVENQNTSTTFTTTAQLSTSTLVGSTDDSNNDQLANAYTVVNTINKISLALVPLIFIALAIINWNSIREWKDKFTIF